MANADHQGSPKYTALQVKGMSPHPCGSIKQCLGFLGWLFRPFIVETHSLPNMLPMLLVTLRISRRFLMEEPVEEERGSKLIMNSQSTCLNCFIETSERKFHSHFWSRRILFFIGWWVQFEVDSSHWWISLAWWCCKNPLCKCIDIQVNCWEHQQFQPHSGGWGKWSSWKKAMTLLNKVEVKAFPHPPWK